MPSGLRRSGSLDLVVWVAAGNSAPRSTAFASLAQSVLRGGGPAERGETESDDVGGVPDSG